MKNSIRSQSMMLIKIISTLFLLNAHTYLFSQVPGDNCSVAIPLSLTSDCSSPMTVSTVGVIRDISLECGQGSLWFSVVVPPSGVVEFKTSTPSSFFDTHLGAYIGTCGSLIRAVNCQDLDNNGTDGHEEIVIVRPPGETIYFVASLNSALPNPNETFSVCALESNLFSNCTNTPNERRAYCMQNNLNEQSGGVPLQPYLGSGTYISDPLLGGDTVYCFAANNGLELDVSTFDMSCTYSIELYFKFDVFGNFYQRIIDFTNGTLEEGLYYKNRTLRFFDVGSNPTVFNQGKDHYYHLVMTYNQGIAQFYIDGQLVLTNSFINPSHALPSLNNNNLIFFKDDGSEDEPGCVRMINVYNYVLSQSDVSSLANDPLLATCTPIPPQQIPTLSQWSLIVLTLLMSVVGILGIRKRIVLN